MVLSNIFQTDIQIVRILLRMAAVAVLLLLWGLCYLKKNAEVEERLERLGIGPKKQISVFCIYVAVNAGLAGAASVFASKYTEGDSGMIKMLLMLAVFAAAAVTDFLMHKIPNILVGTVFLLRVSLFVPEVIGRPDAWQQIVLGSVIPAMVTFLVLTILSVCSRGGIGMGDVKLLTAQTFMCGVSSAVYTLLFALVLAAIVTILLVAASKKRRKDGIALGPFFYIGYVIFLFNLQLA